MQTMQVKIKYLVGNLFLLICCFPYLSAQQFEIDKDKYFKNIVKSYTYFNLKNYAKLGKPVDKER